MNFLGLRSQQTAAQEPEFQPESISVKPTATLESLTVGDPFPITCPGNDHDEKSEGAGCEIGGYGSFSAKTGTPVVHKHIDVREEEGWITIPCKELPGCWSEEPDMVSFRSLDRSFVFPGEQVHILASLSAYKQDTEIITPFKVAEVMIKNGIGQKTRKPNGKVGHGYTPVSEVKSRPDGQDSDQNAHDLVEGKIDPKKDVLAGESLLRMEDHKRQTKALLERFRNSHFFARIAEADEPLWSKRTTQETFRESTEMIGGKFIADDVELGKGANKKPHQNASVGRGTPDASTSGGVARNGFKCSSLANGDIVVLLQVNVGVDILKDPVLEILQFEKYQELTLTPGSTESIVHSNQNPCGDLLKWLLPLDNSVTPPRSLPPPQLSSSSTIRSSSTKINLPGSAGSPIFSFGNFRSYSMSAIPPNNVPSPVSTPPSSRSSFDVEDWDQFSSRKAGKNEKSNGEELLSFRGVPLEPERFSVCCGLEGIYIPGRRWSRKIEIIQPVEIHSFAMDCNTEDLLCVQIKNVTPSHAPDIVIYLDTVAVIYQEASKGGPPSSLPIACIEAGNDHSLPDLALRKGEEHSFILKLETSLWWNSKAQADKCSRSSQSRAGSAASSLHGPPNLNRSGSLPDDKFAVLISCRSNYTESRLFFKQTTNWRPRISRDLLISVASQMSRPILGSDEMVPHLPVQVLTLQASNLTSEDLTLTVLAPASFTSPPSVVSLNSTPATPISPFDASSESIVLQKLNFTSMLPENQGSTDDSGPRIGSLNEQTVAITDVLPRSDLGCTHLWLQSRVPLGCVPSRSTATIKLELLPLTDGIITLDSLQIDVKEKGVTYVPEHSLKINATSSISTGII